MAFDEPHPAPDTPIDLARALTLGIVAGLRSMVPLALDARLVGEEGADIADGGWVLEILAQPATGTALAFATLGEFIADKLPATPSRVDPLPLAGRVVAGGTAGALHSLAIGHASDRGALLGCAGAIVGSLLGYWWRTRVPLPGLVLALTEDAAALGLGAWALRR
jgi:uncharacterized membrane protein